MTSVHTVTLNNGVGIPQRGFGVFYEMASTTTLDAALRTGPHPDTLNW
ncbi:hypothetical protein ACWD0A_04515 [Streptomyces sp. NPDC002867]